MSGNVPGRTGTDGLWLHDKSVGLHVLQQFCGGARPALATLWPLGRAVLQHGRTAEVRAGRPLTDTAAHPGNLITFLVLRCSVRSNDSFKIRNNNILTLFILHPVKLQNWSNEMSVLVILCWWSRHIGDHTHRASCGILNTSGVLCNTDLLLNFFWGPDWPQTIMPTLWWGGAFHNGTAMQS